jgi:hypothetical protein
MSLYVKSILTRPIMTLALLRRHGCSLRPAFPQRAIHCQSLTVPKCEDPDPRLAPQDKQPFQGWKVRRDTPSILPDFPADLSFATTLTGSHTRLGTAEVSRRGTTMPTGDMHTIVAPPRPRPEEEPARLGRLTITKSRIGDSERITGGHHPHVQSHESV